MQGETRGHGSRCASCGASIGWARTGLGAYTPVNLDGTPHWATCPQARDWKGKTRNQMAQLGLFQDGDK